MSASSSPSPSQRLRLNPSSGSSETDGSGILNERILVLVFESIKWDIPTLCHTASVSRKLRAVAHRLLWKEMCVYRAPRMISSLTDGLPNGRIGGGWHALAKLLFFCCGCESTRYFKLSEPLSGHFLKETRFSKTSGRSFLSKRCRGDMLYVSDPCEHAMGGGGGEKKEDDLGIYRGVFKGFLKSKTRSFLITRQVALEERVRCPYCGARVWSMTAARLIPKSAARRLGSDGELEYFVCVNGHLYGSCWLVPLSSDGDDDDDHGDANHEEAYDDDDDENDCSSEDADDDVDDDPRVGNGSCSGVSNGTTN